MSDQNKNDTPNSDEDHWQDHTLDDDIQDSVEVTPPIDTPVDTQVDTQVDSAQQQKKLRKLYIIFAVTLLFSIIPHIAATSLAMIFFTWLLIAAYIARSGSTPHDLLHNHTTFIISSVWISTLFSVLSLGASIAYLFSNIDYAAFDACAQKIGITGTQTIGQMNILDIQMLILPCMESFMGANGTVFLIATMIAGLPPLIYLAYRFVKGVLRVKDGDQLAAPKSWF